jgi:hypothetical protein
MATKKVVKKVEPVSAVEIPSKPNFSHFISLKENRVSFLCMGNGKWIDINPVDDIANDLNYCPFCGAKLDGLKLHQSVSKLIKPSERFSG